MQRTFRNLETSAIMYFSIWLQKYHAVFQKELVLSLKGLLSQDINDNETLEYYFISVSHFSYEEKITLRYMFSIFTHRYKHAI